MADKSPEEIVTAAEKEANAKIDKEVWGGPTIFVNRANVQGYSGAGVRLSFAEQFSADLDVLPTFRVAVYMHPSTAAQLAQMLVNTLPPGSVTLPLVPTAIPNAFTGFGSLGATFAGLSNPPAAGTINTDSTNKLTGKP